MGQSHLRKDRVPVQSLDVNWWHLHSVEEIHWSSGRLQTTNLEVIDAEFDGNLAESSTLLAHSQLLIKDTAAVLWTCRCNIERNSSLEAKAVTEPARNTYKQSVPAAKPSETQAPSWWDSAYDCVCEETWISAEVATANPLATVWVVGAGFKRDSEKVLSVVPFERRPETGRVKKNRKDDEYVSLPNPK